MIIPTYSLLPAAMACGSTHHCHLHLQALQQTIGQPTFNEIANFNFGKEDGSNMHNVISLQII